MPGSSPAENLLSKWIDWLAVATPIAKGLPPAPVKVVDVLLAIVSIVAVLAGVPDR